MKRALCVISSVIDQEVQRDTPMRTLCRTAQASRAQFDGCPRRALTGLSSRRSQGSQIGLGQQGSRPQRAWDHKGSRGAGVHPVPSTRAFGPAFRSLDSGNRIQLQGSVADAFSNIPSVIPGIYVRSPRVKPIGDARESVRFWKTPSRIRARRQSTAAKNPVPESPVNAPTGTGGKPAGWYPREWNTREWNP